MIIWKANYFAKRKLKKFKNNYLNLYDEDIKNEINEILLSGFTNNNDVINQIYCYLNIIKDEINPYKEFIKIIKKYFKINCNILEVGSGYIPILAKYLENDAKVTMVDPKIIFKNYAKGTIKNESFTLNTNLEQYNLIIGYNPCEATESMIRNAISNQKDFAIATCGCCYLPLDYPNRTKKEWHKYLIRIANELGNNEYNIIIEFFSSSFHINNPIIIGKRKK